MIQKTANSPRATPQLRTVLRKRTSLRWQPWRWLGAAVLATAGAVYVCLWIERDRDAADLPPPLGIHRATQPVAEIVQGAIRRHVRAKLIGRQAAALFSEDETIERFVWPHTSAVERGTMAYRLARIGTPRALAVLSAGVATAPPAERAILAQELGTTGNPAVRDLLFSLLDDPDPEVVAAAIRGLSNFADPAVTARLAQILESSTQPEALRIETALALGESGTMAAREALVRAWNHQPTVDLAPEILTALGKFPYPRVAPIFEELLASATTEPEVKVTALEALAHSSKEAVPMLLRVAQTDPAADLREAAAWSISAHGETTDLGPVLTDCAAREPEPDVRRRVYEALLVQAAPPVDRLITLADRETNSPARVAALNAVAAAIERRADTALDARFDARFVPELQRLASTRGSLNLQMRSVFALRRAGTPGAQAALVAIAADTVESSPEIAAAAAQGIVAFQSPNPPTP